MFSLQRKEFIMNNLKIKNPELSNNSGLVLLNRVLFRNYIELYFRRIHQQIQIV